MKIQVTDTYPVRYSAFDNNGILFVAKNPEIRGGYEWAVFKDIDKDIYASITSYQDKGLILTIAKGGMSRTIFDNKGNYKLDDSEYFSQFELLIKKMIEEIKNITK